MLEQKHNEELKADAANRQPAYCKTDVVGSQSHFTDEEVQRAKDFIWQRMSNYDKELMINMSSHIFIESPELKFYLTASVVKEGSISDLQDSRQQSQPAGKA